MAFREWQEGGGALWFSSFLMHCPTNRSASLCEQYICRHISVHTRDSWAPLFCVLCWCLFKCCCCLLVMPNFYGDRNAHTLCQHCEFSPACHLFYVNTAASVDICVTPCLCVALTLHLLLKI